MVNDRHPTCRLCGKELLYTGTHYICEDCDDITEIPGSVGGSLK